MERCDCYAAYYLRYDDGMAGHDPAYVRATGKEVLGSMGTGQKVRVWGQHIVRGPYETLCTYDGSAIPLTYHADFTAAQNTIEQFLSVRTGGARPSGQGLTEMDGALVGASLQIHFMRVLRDIDADIAREAEAILRIPDLAHLFGEPPAPAPAAKSNDTAKKKKEKMD